MKVRRMRAEIAWGRRGSLLIFITNKKEGLQFFLTRDALDAIAFAECFVSVDIEHFMGDAERIDGFEVE